MTNIIKRKKKERERFICQSFSPFNYLLISFLKLANYAYQRKEGKEKSERRWGKALLIQWHEKLLSPLEMYMANYQKKYIRDAERKVCLISMNRGPFRTSVLKH